MNSYYNFYGAWASSMIAFLGIFAIIIVIIVLAILIFYLVGLWKLFQKAGKNGWEAIIPFYNTWTLVDISGLSWWYFLLMIANTVARFLDLGNLQNICRIISLVGAYCCYYNIAKRFHKDAFFAILMTIFPVIMIPLVGLSNGYQYDANVGVDENGPFGKCNVDRNVSSTSSNTYSDTSVSNGHNVKYCSFCGSPVQQGQKYCGNCGHEIYKD